MSIECGYCERDLRGPHDDDCPRVTGIGLDEPVTAPTPERRKVLPAAVEGTLTHEQISTAIKNVRSQLSALDALEKEIDRALKIERDIPHTQRIAWKLENWLALVRRAREEIE